MAERALATGERVARAHQMTEINVALHDLCQPLTSLQCQLEIARLVGTPAAFREGVEEGLAECRRMVAAIGTMRAVVQREAVVALGVELEAVQ